MTPQPKKEKKKPEKASSSSNSIENKNKYGTIRMNENVIFDVIKKATCSVEGITKLSGGTFIDSIANMIGNHRVSDRAITFCITKNTLTAEVKVNVLYGEHIPKIATDVQNTISKEIKRITGLNVIKVDVIIQDIEHPINVEEE